MKTSLHIALATIACACTASCASIDFDSKNSKALTYYESVPVITVTDTADCKQAVSLMVVPGRPKKVHFRPGYGSSSMSVKLNNGMINEAGQEADSKLFETLELVAGATLANMDDRISPGSTTSEELKPCKMQTRIYAVKWIDGKIEVGDGVMGVLPGPEY